MKKHPEQNEQFEAQLRNLPDTVNQSLAGLTAGTELNNRIQMAVRDSRASRQKKSFPVRRFVSVACAPRQQRCSWGFLPCCPPLRMRR